MNPLESLADKVPHLKHSFDSTPFIGEMTQYIFWMLIVLAIVLLVVLISAKSLKLIPRNKFVSAIEVGYDFVRKDMGANAIGHGFEKHVPFLATLFFFILTANLVGLIPGCKTPTGSLSVTWALAIISFVYFNYYGIKAKGGIGYLKSICPSGLPAVMVPIVWFFEFVSMILRALTLAVRLYGNMFAGHMVLGIFALATSVFLIDGIAAIGPLAGGGISIGWFLLLCCMYALEMLVACLQAYIFAILSAVYIGLATSEH